MVGDVIYIGSDHAGFELKQILDDFLRRGGYMVEDLGPDAYDPDDDYPDYALKVCKKVLETKKRGILICGSGQGMDIAANKIPGIHAALCWNEESARFAKKHDNVNVLCLAGRLTEQAMAKRIVDIWMNEEFEGAERHLRRIRKIDEIEKGYRS